MAARDRFGTWQIDPGESQLKRFIRDACDPSNFEPNLALSLEIADLINQKKGSAPREAAVTIVKYINHRNPTVSMLALHLLDICVKNCGYPFHLQISTKDFLNELVRRFPERPPPHYGPVQNKILELIEEWRSSICQTSRYKEDLGFIRDMHRLLSHKGYRFPEVHRDDVAVLNPNEGFKSAEEMEEEEREAQSAKLQELIRRGTPQDLQQANHLMKIMAGYDQSSKTDYRAKAAEEIQKLKSKAVLLEEMLTKVKPGESIGRHDTFEELASALVTAQPKIQKMVEEESDDTEAVVKILELNDAINTTIQRYRLVKKGDIAEASKLPSIEAIAQGAKPPAATETSLIDLLDDGPAESAPAPAISSGAGSLQDDLLGLSLDDPNSSFGSGGGIALGFGANTGVPGPPLLSSTMHGNSANSPAPPSPSPAPNLNAIFGNLVAPPRPSSTIQPSPLKPSLTGGSFTGFSIGGTSSSSQLPQKSDDDDWAFQSALPPSSALATNEALVLDSNLRVVIEATRPPGSPDGIITLKAKFSNNASQPIQDLTFQAAVPRAYQLRMEPQSGRTLLANQKNGVSQIIRIANAPSGGGSVVKMRWKASYRVGSGPLHEEQGTIEGLPVA